ncbi:MAG: type II toxin-antitoxin system VapC family toxin [Proteobacteria bacterium]|nr:type II toxin-antitoxin system VapC family toxin [Pseudomonadota bacterium]
MPLRYLLDTNIISNLVRDPHGAVAKRIALVGEDSVCTSIVIAAELRYGAQKSESRQIAERVNLLLSAIAVLPLESPVDRHYGEIRHYLAQRGTSIGPNDLLFAAHALALDLVLVTANTREFERVSDLKLENWLSE